MVEGRRDLATRDSRQPLNAVEVGVLDGHDARLREELLRVVVDELAVDEAVDAVADNAANFSLHALLLRGLNLGDLGHAVHAHLGAEDFDLVRVHGRVREENARLAHLLGLADADGLVEDKALLEVRVAQAAARLLDNLDEVQVQVLADA